MILIMITFIATTFCYQYSNYVNHLLALDLSFSLNLYPYPKGNADTCTQIGILNDWLTEIHVISTDN